MDTDSAFTCTIEKIPSPAVFVYTLPNILVGELSIRHGWKGENLFLVEEKFNAEHLIEQVQMLFNNTSTEVCVVGWAEFLNEINYKACLWMIAGSAPKGCRTLSKFELVNDFGLIG